MIGLRRGIASIAVIRDFYAQGKPPPGRSLHPAVVGILGCTVAGRSDLVPAIDRLLQTARAFLQDAEGDVEVDARRFDGVVNQSFDDLLPAISILVECTEAAVATVRARNEAAAEQARTGAEAALRRIAQLTRIVRMISVNARVEAARAGAAGRSFNVIASEITDLAAQVETARTDISHRIEDIVTSFRAV